MPKTNYKKKPYKKRPYKKNATMPKHIYGISKNNAVESPNSTMATNGASRLIQIEVSNLATGDLFNQRAGNKILLNNVVVRMNLRNNSGTMRYIRCMLVTFRNNLLTSPVISSNLLATANFTSVIGPTGLAEDIVYQPNYSLYNVLYDKVYQLGSVTNAWSAKNLKFTVPVNRIVTYEYNSASARQNTTYLLWYLCESEGVATSATTVALNYNVKTYFKDVVK